MAKDQFINKWVSTKREDTSELVLTRFAEAKQYGEEVREDLAEFMSQLENIAYQPLTFNLDVDYPEAPTAVDIDIAGDLPELPTFDGIPDSEDIDIDTLQPLPSVTLRDIGNFEGLDALGTISELSLRDVPDAPTLDGVEDIPTADLLDIPGYAGDDITFSNPEKPAPLVASTPESPSLEGLSVPTAPTMDAVQSPNIDDIPIPAIPNVSIPTFNGVKPDNNLTPPNLTFSFDEGGYSYESCIKENLPAKICAVLSGEDALVLDDDIIDGILQSAVEDLEIEAAKSYDEILNGWALKGHDLPQGAMVGRLDELRAETDRQKAGVIRDIGAKQSELAIDAIKHAMTVGAQYEGVLAELFNQIQNRTFEAAKIVQDSALKIFDTQVQIYNSNIDLYKAEASVYAELIRGNVAIYDGYKAQMDGVKVQAEVQQSKVSIYAAQLSANEIASRVYESQIRAVVARAEIERLKIERFKAEVEAYNSKVNAKTAELAGYDSEVKAELAKAQIAEAKIRGYTAQIEGLARRNEAELLQVQAVIEKNKGIAANNSAVAEMFKVSVAAVEAVNNAEALRVRSEADRNSAISASNTAKANVFEAETNAVAQYNDIQLKKLQAEAEQNKSISMNNQVKLETFKAEVMAIAEKNQAEAQRYGSEMTGYQERVRASLMEYESVLKKYQADSSLWDVKSKLALEEAKEETRVAMQEYELSLRSAETGSKVYAQLAASAMNMVNASAQVGFSGSANNSARADLTKPYETFSHNRNESISN